MDFGAAIFFTDYSINLPPVKADEVLPMLDRGARFMREVQA